jgi:hypothetical protein
VLRTDQQQQTRHNNDAITTTNTTQQHNNHAATTMQQHNKHAATTTQQHNKHDAITTTNTQQQQRNNNNKHDATTQQTRSNNDATTQQTCINNNTITTTNTTQQHNILSNSKEFDQSNEPVGIILSFTVLAGLSEEEQVCYLLNRQERSRLGGQRCGMLHHIVPQVEPLERTVCKFCIETFQNVTFLTAILLIFFPYSNVARRSQRLHRR